MFTFDGEVVSTLRTPHSPVWLAQVDPGHLLAVGDSSDHLMPLDEGRNVRRVRLFLLRVDPSGQADTLARIDGLEAEAWWDGAEMTRFGTPWYLLKNWLAVSDQGLWFSDGASWEVLRHSAGDGRIDRVIRIDRALQPFTDERAEAFHEAAFQASEAGKHPAVGWDHRDAHYPAAVPPIRDLFYDAVGALWIGLLERPVLALPYHPPDPLVHRWLLLGEDGKEVGGVLTLPEGRRPLHADLDGVLTVSPDIVGTPLVEWTERSRPDRSRWT